MLSTVIDGDTLLYTVSLDTGAATFLRRLYGIVVTDFTFSIPAPAGAGMLALATFTVTRRRRF